jgi:hypothetical protein
MKNIQLWEILVPASSKKKKIAYKWHKVWDEKVRQISGGLTILRPAKGQWVSPTGIVFKDRMIPVRIACSENQLMKILDLTIKHYDEEAIFAALISEKVIIKHK